MFKYKREAIFEYKDLELLDQIDESNFLDLYRTEEEIDNLRTIIDSEIKDSSEYYFKTGLLSKAKQLSDIRRSLKSRGKINFEDVILDKNIEKWIYLLIEKESFCLELEKEIQKSLGDKNYAYFLDNILFKKYIKEIQPINYKYILNEDGYNKGKDRKTRYNYIQRNIVKSNTISYSGITSFVDNGDRCSEEIQGNQLINPFYITCFLILISRIENVKKLLRYHIPVEVNLFDEKALFNAKLYLMSVVKGFYVRDNLLFRKDIVHFMNQYNSQKGISYTALDRFPKGADLLIQNDVVSPFFSYYLDNLDELRKIISSNESLEMLFNDPSTFDITQKEKLLNQSKGDRKLVDRLINELKNTTKYISYPAKSMTKKNYDKIKMNLTPEQKEYIKSVVVRDATYDDILNLIMSKIDFSNKNLLDTLFEVESKLIYKTDYWEDTKTQDHQGKKFDLYEKRSFQVFFNQLSDGEVIINNIFPGNGFLLGREFPKLTRKNKSNVISELKDNFSNDFQFYELVINNHTSIINNTGNTNLPKLKWPEDLKRVNIEFRNNKLTFLLEGTPINILYFGSIPPQQFSGVERILLKIISPWKMKMNNGLINNVVNKRKILQIRSQEFRHLIDVKNIEETTLNFLRYFQKKNLPKKFFLYSKNNSFFVKKPQYITLFNKEAVSIFANEITKNDNLLIMECKPSRDSYDGHRLEEFICIFNEEAVL